MRVSLSSASHAQELWCTYDDDVQQSRCGKDKQALVKFMISYQNKFSDWWNRHHRHRHRLLASGPSQFHSLYYWPWCSQNRLLLYLMIWRKLHMWQNWVGIIRTCTPDPTHILYMSHAVWLYDRRARVHTYTLMHIRTTSACGYCVNVLCVYVYTTGMWELNSDPCTELFISYSNSESCNIWRVQE